MKNGFTLAEVLITLVIIGVIGALTVPSLIQNTRKQEYVSALKKTYSTLSQAAQMIIAEEGSPKGEGSWLTDSDALYNMFKKYLNYAKDCGSESGCFAPGAYKRRDGNYSNEDRFGPRKLALADGIIVGFYEISQNCALNYIDYTGSDKVCAIINVDINGHKKPNKWGVDAFTFVLKENGLYPSGCDNTEDLCITQNNSFACACKVLREGAMNY